MSNIKIVIGSNFGDEGKGLMTDYFAAQARDCGENCIVVCSNGGSQRGHTVTTPDGIRHIFHHFGSGTLVGADTYLPEYFIVNPMSFRSEHETLKRQYVNPDFIVSPRCHFSTPFDMMANQIIENSRGDDRHGSCGMGIWETILRCEEFEYMTMEYLSEHIIDNNNANKIYCDLKNIKKYYEKRFRELNIQIPDGYLETWNSDVLLYHYISDFNYMLDHILLWNFNNLYLEYRNIIFENGQGLLLDQNIKGYGDNTTPSNTGITNPILLLNEVLNYKDVEVCYVTRTYLTRHGAGRFDEECDKSDINPDMIDLTNVDNEFQGKLRYGNLNIDELISRINEDFHYAPPGWKKSLAITHINENPWKYDIFNKEFDYVYKSNGETRKSIKRKEINHA